MLGYVSEERGRGAGRIRLNKALCCQVPFLTMEITGREGILRRHRVQRGWQEMYRCGVRRAVMPLHLTEEAACWGIAPVEEAALRRTMLPELLSWLENDRKIYLQQGTVCLRASCADRAVMEAAELLAQRARYLVLQIDRGQETLETHLRREFGLSSRAGGRPMAEVCFGAEAGTAPTIFIGRGCAGQQRVEWCLREEWRERILPWEPSPQLLAALFQEDALPASAISVKSIGFHA